MNTISPSRLTDSVALLQTQQFIVAALDGQIVGAPWQDGNTVSTSSAAATLMLD